MWPHLKQMLDSYFYLDPSSDESLEEMMERVKADCPADEVAAIRSDISRLLGLSDAALDAAYQAELQSYYAPEGDGLTPRQWFSRMNELLAAPPDTSRDHRSGAYSR